MHMRVILHSQFDRIDVQRVRELVDGRLQGERPFGFPGSRIQPGVGMLWRIWLACVNTFGHA